MGLERSTRASGRRWRRVRRGGVGHRRGGARRGWDNPTRRARCARGATRRTIRERGRRLRSPAVRARDGQAARRRTVGAGVGTAAGLRMRRATSHVPGMIGELRGEHVKRAGDEPDGAIGVGQAPGARSALASVARALGLAPRVAAGDRSMAPAMAGVGRARTVRTARRSGRPSQRTTRADSASHMRGGEHGEHAAPEAGTERAKRAARGQTAGPAAAGDPRAEVAADEDRSTTSRVDPPAAASTPSAPCRSRSRTRPGPDRADERHERGAGIGARSRARGTIRRRGGRSARRGRASRRCRRASGAGARRARGARRGERRLGRAAVELVDERGLLPGR